MAYKATIGQCDTEVRPIAELQTSGYKPRDIRWTVNKYVNFEEEKACSRKL